MKDPRKGERRIEGIVVDRVPALGGPTKATVVIRLDRIGRLLHRAENSVRGRALSANGAIEIVLEKPHPMAGEGPLLGCRSYTFPA